ncbi:hypothetical protein WME75_41235 [Sorangium sp. So ce1014]|uniref:hypothetical protein n=1 Tax=Sorangium sp. So ce1014 TaxID=3133326 RepID=UPI003F5D9962
MATIKKATAAGKKNGAAAAAKKAGAARAATAAGKKSGAARATKKAKVISAGELAALVGVAYKPTLKTSEVQRLRRALPGYINLLDDVAELVEEDADVLRVKDVGPDDLLRVQAAHKELSAREAVLEAVYMSAYHQRLVLDHEGIGMLQKIARRISALAEDHPDMPLRYKSLLDFLSTFRGGGRPAKGAAPSEAAPAEEG